MPRFSDEWVIDRSLFEFVSGGSCVCCSFQGFLPDGVSGMIKSISDIETDAAQAEISALQKSPWPPEMREQVWGDRVRLRYKLKKEMHKYKKFWDEQGDAFSEWCRNIPGKTFKKILQAPRSEIVDQLPSYYGIGIHLGFGVVFTVVTEQVANFDLTKYPVDARGEAETAFEKILTFDRRGGFTIKIQNSDGTCDMEAVEILLNRIRTLGGPKLLERAPSKKKASHSDDEGGADDAERDDDDDAPPGPSFRSDRRIVRLLIARYWANNLMKRYETQRLTQLEPCYSKNT